MSIIGLQTLLQPLPPKFDFESFYQIITAYSLTLEDFSAREYDLRVAEVKAIFEEIFHDLIALNKKYLDVKINRDPKEILRQRATRRVIIFDEVIKIDSYEEALRILQLITEHTTEFFNFLIVKLKKNEESNILLSVKVHIDGITMRFKKLYEIFGRHLDSDLLSDGEI